MALGLAELKMNDLFVRRTKQRIMLHHLHELNEIHGIDLSVWSPRLPLQISNLIV